jgi:hypothetical protein
VERLRAEHMLTMRSKTNWISPQMIAQIEGTRFALTFLIGKVAVACVGAVEIWPGRYLGWARVDHDAARGRWKSIHRATLNFVAQVREEARRFEVNTDCGDAAARRWVEHLGFSLECDRMPGFFPDGRSGTMYAIAKEH